MFRILVPAFSIQIYDLSLLNANEYNKEELDRHEFPFSFHIAGFLLAEFEQLISPAKASLGGEGQHEIANFQKNNVFPF